MNNINELKLGSIKDLDKKQSPQENIGEEFAKILKEEINDLNKTQKQVKLQ